MGGDIMENAYGTVIVLLGLCIQLTAGSGQAPDAPIAVPNEGSEVVDFLRASDAVSSEALFGGDWFYQKHAKAYGVLVGYCCDGFTQEERESMVYEPHTFLAQFPKLHAAFRGRACWLAEQRDPYFMEAMISAEQEDRMGGGVSEEAER